MANRLPWQQKIQWETPFIMVLAALKKEVGDPHFLLLKNNQHVAFKPSANFKKILGSEFRATFIFPKIKVALNPLPRFFFLNLSYEQLKPK